MPGAVLGLLVAGALSSSGAGAPLAGLVLSTSRILSLVGLRVPGALLLLLVVGSLIGPGAGSLALVGCLGLLVLGDLVEVVVAGASGLLCLSLLLPVCRGRVALCVGRACLAARVYGLALAVAGLADTGVALPVCTGLPSGLPLCGG